MYGPRKVWWQLRRDGVQVGRGRIERLMREMGLAGVMRGKTVRTTVQDKDGIRAADLNTWAGTVYVAFAIDVFSRRIVGWRARMSKETDLVLDAIDMGLRQRQYRPGPEGDKLVHHSD